MRRYRRHPDVLWRNEVGPQAAAERGLEAGEDVADVATSVLLLHGQMLTLNVLGTEIWQRCDGKTLDELVGEITSIFDVPADEAREDVAQFLQALEGHGFFDDA